MRLQFRGKWLVEGIHKVTWAELIALFGTNQHRLMLAVGLLQVALALKAAGCRVLYVDGSFVSNIIRPNDFDACYEEAGVDDSLLDPVLRETRVGHREAQKQKYGGETFPAHNRADVSKTYLEFFQHHETLRGNKGIVQLDLEELDANQE